MTTNVLTALLVLATALLRYRYCVSSRGLCSSVTTRTVNHGKPVLAMALYEAKRLYCEFTKTDLRKF